MSKETQKTEKVKVKRLRNDNSEHHSKKEQMIK